VFYFSSTLFANAGLDVKYILVMIGTFNLLMTAVSVWLMDRAGRRPLALLSLLGMLLGCALIIFSRLIGNGLLVIAGILLYVGSFAVGMGPVPWVILGEIFPSSTIQYGVPLAIGTNWVCNTIISFTTIHLFNALGDLTFLPFAAVIGAFLAYNFFRIPETKGMTPNYL
jgi:SP family facilitated glucose transporter-like MFS transporter 1